jgi:2-octaprenyl-6-methoxyphenol hydroxylase
MVSAPRQGRARALPASAMPQASDAEVVVVGGGPAGLTAAVALASAGVETVLFGPKARDDRRTTALMTGSVAALEALGVWDRCRPNAAPLRVMRIVDDTGRLIRAPEVAFAAEEIGQDAFGYNVENRHLVAALEMRAAELGALRRIIAPADAVELEKDHASVSAGTIKIRAQLVVAADGRNSPCRAAAGIATDGWSYPQTALALNFAHTHPHGDASTEFHTPSGPFTLVPLPGLRASLVWVVEPAEADRLLALSDGELSIEIERRAHSVLGKVAVETGRGAFSLAIQTARVFGARRVALVGEAAHVIPPIGAQGLNLGVRDAATIAELVASARREGADIGADALLARYDQLRRSDVTTRSMTVDLLNRSLLSDFLPLQGARGLGLYVLDRFPPLRRAFMREGIAPAAATPRLMRGEAL